MFEIHSHHVQEDILPTPHVDLPPAAIEALRAADEMCVENKMLTQKIITLEEQNHIPRGIIAKRLSPPPPKKMT